MLVLKSVTFIFVYHLVAQNPLRGMILQSVVLLLQQSWASGVTYCVTLSPGGVTLTGLLTSLYPIVSQQKEILPTCTSEVL